MGDFVTHQVLAAADIGFAAADTGFAAADIGFAAADIGLSTYLATKVTWQ
jgi:hypothetical protein